MSPEIAAACAWHLARTPSVLVPLNGTTVDAAVLALEDRTLSHGICAVCETALYAQHGLTRRST